jgi:hypothetical protein
METPVYCIASCVWLSVLFPFPVPHEQANHVQFYGCKYLISRMTKEEVNELSQKEVFEEVISNVYNEVR